MTSRKHATQLVWPTLAVIFGVASWAALVLLAPVGRSWTLLAVIVLVPFVLAPLRPGDGWWQGVAALVTSLWWLVMGSGHPLWQPCLIGALLAIYWLTSAWTAQAPLWAEHAPGYIGRRLGYLVTYVAACGVGLVLVCLSTAVAPLPLSGAWAFGGAAVVLAGLVGAAFLIERR